MANERLRLLEEVEKEIAMVLQCAGEIRSRSGCSFTSVEFSIVSTERKADILHPLSVYVQYAIIRNKNCGYHRSLKMIT